MILWLGISLGASSLWLVILFVSDRLILQLWPPRRGNYATGIAAWLLTIAIYVGLIRTATADWNALDLPAWLRWGVGGLALSVAATWVQGRGILDLGIRGTSGWDVGLVTTGAYARRRHPQYAGQILSLLGLALLGGSLPAGLAAVAGSAALVYAARVEDRFLARRQPGHEAYRTRVRFF
ncbi:methyltransferase family protein [Palleronia sp. LCG004]|uniref:methyltransferase family protein n=1 Tax=Palleronia sp. LCG004 TaxID=3079304 RepID=UPI0029433C93|nr:methyltransferase [Palleronia sp. LCG004]WOI57238.1 methyltransferase [Palleronia sp. LCG004]